MDDFKTNETLDIKSCPIEFPNLLCEEKSIEPQTFSHVKQTKRSDVSDQIHVILFQKFLAQRRRNPTIARRDICIYIYVYVYIYIHASLHV